MPTDDEVKRRQDDLPIDDIGAKGDSHLAPGVGALENLSEASEAEAARQDPDAVPNRLQEPEPPRPERVGPPPDPDEASNDQPPA